MTLLTRVEHPRAGRSHPVARVPAATAVRVPEPAPPSVDESDQRVVNGRVFAVQRGGAVVVGLVLLVFGLLGLTSGVPFLSTRGEQVLGLSSNGFLSTISVVVAAVLVGAALRSPRVASSVMIVLGLLFLISALANMAVLRTSLNILAFRMSNVVFSVVVGLLLLVLGCYGRVSGNLPADSPYAHPTTGTEDDGPEDFPSTPEEVAAEAAMRAAEIAGVERRASADQRRRVEAMSRVITRQDRRRVWMSFDR